ncbi:uncharacterized protein DS421_14g452160 [Arachis hypogaea]|nr:uncharacterized protein DS421_14g452160 [Arachis hypogaea]
MGRRRFSAPRRGLPLFCSSPWVVAASPLIFVSASLLRTVSRRRCFSSCGVSSLCYNPLRSQVSSSLLQAFNPLRSQVSVSNSP